MLAAPARTVVYLAYFLMDDQSQHSSNFIHIAPTEVEEKFSAKMAELKLKELEREVRDAAVRQGLGYLSLVGVPIATEALKVISRERAAELHAICFLKSASELRLAVLRPDAPELKGLLDELTGMYKVPIGLYLVSSRSMQSALAQYDTLPKLIKTTSGIEITEQDLGRFEHEHMQLQGLAERITRTPLTEVLSLLIATATQSRATDIHIEAEENDVKVRYRIDGVLHTVATLPKESWKKLISRIKLLAGLKLNIEDRPQDGRINLSIADQKIDIRVSTVPTSNGESIALRLLLSTEVGLNFEDIGLRGQPFEELKRQIDKPNGMIIATGPTGSGKTTTLYSILKRLNRPETKIITLEDPIEYRLEGVNQSQVSADEGYTFARGLKHALRQDPDIIMVGEIRDLETADISIQATLTGHLVLSTLHTNNAAGAIPRFLSIGVKPYLLAPALNAIIGQRLVRRICPDCTQATELDHETLARVQAVLASIPESSSFRVDPGKPLTFSRGAGCASCNNVGYKGRVGIFEVITMNPELEKLVLAGNTSDHDIMEIARTHGSLTMVQDGILKALESITSVDEVFRVAA